MIKKESQDRGTLNKLREKVNLSGKLLESLNPEFKDMMERLRETDEWVRDQARSLKEDLSLAKGSFKNRDYLLSSNQLSTFHESARAIAFALDRFKDSVNLNHYKFLLDQIDPENRDKLLQYDPESNPRTAAYVKTTLIKNADLASWFSDITSKQMGERGKAMQALEKR